ncbi:FAS1-like dehydratase domain-containing protein [Rhodococcus sp. ACT016]|uniref:FAS1-like dehydratase domain-containing protein n=1 Tax=Rhodococcus sp. ACT016 TaxID=3134808 RepID=UPI003D2AC897
MTPQPEPNATPLTDLALASTESWEKQWDPVIRAVGSQISTLPGEWGAEKVEATGIRRWCEPLEFSCALHYDPSVASAHGYADVTAPYTAITSFSLPPTWSPGIDPVFTTAGRDAQPTRSPVAALPLPGAPATTGFFATEVESTYLRPLVVGDQVKRSGMRLISCVPKHTRVGRGAFVTLETEIVDQNDTTVAITRVTLFYHHPNAESGPTEEKTDASAL